MSKANKVKGNTNNEGRTKQERSRGMEEGSKPMMHFKHGEGRKRNKRDGKDKVSEDIKKFM